MFFLQLNQFHQFSSNYPIQQQQIKSKFYYQNSNFLRTSMLSSGFKRPHNQPSETSAMSSIYQANIDGSKVRPLSSKRDSEMSILEKLNSSKFKNIQDLDISNKIILPNDSRSKYFVFNQDMNSESHNLKTHNQPYKYSQTDDKMLTFSPINLKYKQTESRANLKTKNQDKQNNISRTPSRQRFLNPTQSWMHKITPQKPAKKAPLHNHSKIIHERTEKQHFTPFSIHQQLYLESRKKQIKRSAEKIIENEYFKKIHPFKPEVNQVSQFLAQQKRTKIKERNNFEKEFEEFSQYRQKSSSIQKSKKTKTDQKDMNDAGKNRQNQQKQTELKNYALLKQFFFYLSQNEPVLSYQKLTPKRLCELPSVSINLLDPILEQFYKNKKTKKLEWLQFLSEFNLKVQKKKSFYLLIEKWFWIKYKLRFDSKSKASFVEYEKEKNYENSTYVGNETTCHQERGSRANLTRIY